MSLKCEIAECNPAITKEVAEACSLWGGERGRDRTGGGGVLENLCIIIISANLHVSVCFRFMTKVMACAA